MYEFCVENRIGSIIFFPDWIESDYIFKFGSELIRIKHLDKPSDSNSSNDPMHSFISHSMVSGLPPAGYCPVIGDRQT